MFHLIMIIALLFLFLPHSGEAQILPQPVVQWQSLQGMTLGSTWRDRIRAASITLTNMTIPGSTTSGWTITPSPPFKYEVRFDGSNDLLSLPLTPPITGGKYTFVFVMRQTFASGILMEMQSNFSGNRLMVSLTGGNWGGNNRAISILMNSGTTSNLGSTNSIPATGTHQIVLVLDAATNTGKGYVNGQWTGEGYYEETIVGALYAWVIGNRVSLAEPYFSLALSEFSVYNQLLTVPQIQQLYAQWKSSAKPIALAFLPSVFNPSTGLLNFFPSPQ